MATYFQWKTRHPENRLVYYICGEEYALVQEVKDAVIQQWRNVNALKLDVVTMKWKDIETAILMSRDGITLLCIENCQLLKDRQWELIVRLAHSIVNMLIKDTLLVVTTNEVNPDTSVGKFRPFVEKGRYVECKQLSVDNLKKYCQSELNISESAVDVLMELCSYNFRKLNNEIEKLRMVEIPSIEESHIKKLVVFSPDDLLINYLMCRNVEMAKKVVSMLNSKDCARVLGVLTKKLCFIQQALTKDAPGLGAHQLAARLDIQPWQLLEYFSLKRIWDLGRVDDKLKLMCELESIYVMQRDNVLTFLVCWW